MAAARLVAQRERRRAGAVGRRGGLRLVAGELRTPGSGESRPMGNSGFQYFKKYRIYLDTKYI